MWMTQFGVVALWGFHFDGRICRSCVQSLGLCACGCVLFCSDCVVHASGVGILDDRAPTLLPDLGPSHRARVWGPCLGFGGFILTAGRICRSCVQSLGLCACGCVLFCSDCVVHASGVGILDDRAPTLLPDLGPSHRARVWGPCLGFGGFIAICVCLIVFAC